MTEYEVVHEKSPAFYDRYERKGELQQQTHYCPGCGHGVVHKLIAEGLTELGLKDRTVLVSPVGCSVFAYYYFDVGNVQAAHGRASAVATALKRAHPESIVISYQGDGDLAAIGTAEIVHAANRGENICVFFVNNSIYGMTGGQLAPTTLVGQYSTTSPWGRRPNNDGLPIHVAELLASLETPTYIERVALSDMKNIMKARKAVHKALEIQKNGGGFSLVEILSPCPTILKMDPLVARKWVGETLVKTFPLGVFRDRKPDLPESAKVPHKTVAEALEVTESNPEVILEGRHHPRDHGKLRRIRRTRRPADGPVTGRDGTPRADGSELVAVVRPGDAVRQRALLRHPVARTHRIAAHLAPRSPGRDERNLAAQVCWERHARRADSV